MLFKNLSLSLSLSLSCSGGIDRTGLLIAMETALTKIEIVEAFNPLDIVREMRDQRGMMLPALVRVDVRIMVMAHVKASCPPVFKVISIRQTDRL